MNLDNSALVAFLRDLREVELAQSVASYPLPIPSAAALLDLKGASCEIATLANGFFVAAYERSLASRQLTPPPQQPTTAGGAAAAPTVSEDALHQLKLRHQRDLKDECARLGLLTTGTKIDLATRILKFRERAGVADVPVQVASKPAVKKVDPFDFISPGGAKPGPPPAADAGFTLLVDNRERMNSSHATMLEHFARQEVRTLTTVLPCGDFWLCCSQSGKVLPIVIERKTVSDLLHSVVSSRYGDQKQLLARSPFLEVVYLVEGPLDRLQDEERRRVQSACCTTSIVNGFSVVRTNSLDESVLFIKRLGAAFVSAFAQRPALCETQEACENTCQEIHDTLKRASLFPRMLCHVHGCSGATAVEVSAHGGSLRNMFDVFVDAVKTADYSEAPRAVKKQLAFMADFLSATNYV